MRLLFYEDMPSDQLEFCIYAFKAEVDVNLEFNMVDDDK